MATLNFKISNSSEEIQIANHFCHEEPLRNEIRAIRVIRGLIILKQFLQTTPHRLARIDSRLAPTADNSRLKRTSLLDTNGQQDGRK